MHQIFNRVTIPIFIVLFLISYMGMALLIAYLKKSAILDIPNDRSSHTLPTPRGGGIMIIMTVTLAIIVSYIIDRAFFDWYFLTAFLLLAVVGFMDDQFSLSPLLRFGLQFVAITLVLYSRGGMTALPLPSFFELNLHPYLQVFLLYFWCLAIMNIFNFMDGIDGYAGVQTIIFCTGVYIMFPVPQLQFTFIALGLGTLAFLRFNWQPAVVFLGDVGSIPLGFLIAVMPLYTPEILHQSGYFTTLFLLWFFIADASWVIIRRLLRREKFWLPHREHLYQRLNICGWSHQKIVLTILPMQLILLASLKLDNWITILLAVLCFTGLFLTVKRIESRSE